MDIQRTIADAACVAQGLNGRRARLPIRRANDHRDRANPFQSERMVTTASSEGEKYALAGRWRRECRGPTQTGGVQTRMAGPRPSPATFITSPVIVRAPPSNNKRGVLIVTTGGQVGRVVPFGRNECLTFGRSTDCRIQFNDSSVSRLHARAVSIGSEYMLADATSTNGTYVNNQRIAGAVSLKHGDQVRLGSNVCMRFSMVDAAEEQALLLASERNGRDPLTGLLNRSCLDDSLDFEITEARRKGLPLSVMMIDADRFKDINDAHGHLAGDEALTSLARIMRAAIRNQDTLVRYGGEEFVLVMRATPLEDAHAVAERIRSTVEATPVVWQSLRFQLTVSIGVASLACCGPDADRLSLLFLADQRSYVAKETRNAVVSEGGTLAGLTRVRAVEITKVRRKLG